MAEAGGRFTVVDHTTNGLGSPGQELTTRHYRPQALAAEMQRSHYGLQALLYTVALHRYLRWRLPGYDPDLHLGGVLYLFLRGMTGGGRRRRRAPLGPARCAGRGAQRRPGPGSLMIVASLSRSRCAPDVPDRGR